MDVKCTQVLFITVKRQVLQFQSVTLGLFPRVGYANKPDKIAYVRDSIYAGTAAWALSQAYR